MLIIPFRGKGVVVLPLLVLAAVAMWFVFDDPTLGHRGWLGGTLLTAGGLCLVPAVLSLRGGLRHALTQHWFAYLPLVIWTVLLLALGSWLLATYQPPRHVPGAPRLVGRWTFERCAAGCSADLTTQLTGMTLDIAPDRVTSGTSVRAYDVIVDRGDLVRWRYRDDGSEEPMQVLSDERFVGEIVQPGQLPARVVFRRVAR